MNTLERKQMIFKRLKEHLNQIEPLYEVVGIFLQGSQNYDCDLYDDDYHSDIDTKAIVLPSFDDFVKGVPPISTTYIMENGEHIDIKDIRLMFNLIEKQNPSYVEILFTEFRIINKKYRDIVKKLIEKNEEMARIDKNRFLKSILGFAKEKQAAMTHPYPSLIDKINKYGYDPKQLHHIVRLNLLAQCYIQDLPYAKCLIPNEADLRYLLDIKLGKYTLQQAEEIAEKNIQSLQEMINHYITSNVNQLPNNQILDTLQNSQYEIIKRYFVELLMPVVATKTIKFKPKNIFVTSDNHFFHANVIKFENRPFDDVNDMNNKMIKMWNDKVTNEDLVYIIGDFSFGKAEETNSLLKQLHGKKVLVLGNHDHFVKANNFDKNAFLEICNYKEIEFSGKTFVMCHFPFASNDNKKFQLYGHIHSNKIDGLHHCEYKLPPNSYNVGVDVNNYQPVNLNDILKLIPPKPALWSNMNNRSDNEKI